MTYDPADYGRLRNAVLSFSLVAWIIILVEPRVSSCCSINGAVVSWQMLLSANPPAFLAREWALMLIAMMTPVLVPALYHIRISSFARRQLRSMALFIAGYGAVWMAAGIVLVEAGLIANWRMPGSYLPAIIVGAIAVVWQASPFKQRCLNRCHSHRTLSPFGWDADWDATRMGFEHGFWCTSSCWAAMLFPMLLPNGHFVAMAAVAVLMFCERLDPPGTPSWRWRGFGTAWCYLILRLRGAQYDPAPLAPIS
jgi:predicted metal-binding membrane protein